MDSNRRNFLKKGTVLLAGGSVLGLLQACSKNGTSPIGVYDICQNTCIGCGDCLKVCNDDAVILPELSTYRIDVEECTECGKCKSSCKYGAIKIAVINYILDSEKCIGCGKCIDVCDEETGAISWERDYYHIRGKCKPSSCDRECIAACEEDAIRSI